MAKKLLSLSLVFVMLSVATLAAPGSSMDLFRSYTAQAQDTFSYAGEEIQFFTETVGTASAKHEAVDSLQLQRVAVQKQHLTKLQQLQSLHGLQSSVTL